MNKKIGYLFVQKKINKMASLTRPMPTELLNIRADTGNSVREQLEREQRVADRANKIAALLQQQQQHMRGTYCIDHSRHGPPSTFDRDQILGRKPVANLPRRDEHEEQQFDALLSNQSDNERRANAKHARRHARPVVGVNYVPDTIEDLPECERLAEQRAALDCQDLLHYRIRETDFLRDYWRYSVRAVDGKLQAPPFGRPGPC